MLSVTNLTATTLRVNTLRVMAPQSVRPAREIVAVPRRDEAVEWIARQLRWEETLADLHAPKSLDEAA